MLNLRNVTDLSYCFHILSGIENMLHYLEQNLVCVEVYVNED